jgi:hypothetical protein
MSLFKSVWNTVTKPFSWAGDVLGKVGGTIENAGTTGYRAPDVGAMPSYAMPQQYGTVNFTSPFGGGSSSFQMPLGPQAAPTYSAPHSDFWANAQQSDFWANALRSEFNAINPYNVDYRVNAPENRFKAQQANLSETDYSEAIRQALGQLQGGGAAADTISQYGDLADVLRGRMAGQGPSLAQLQLLNALNQNTAQTAGAMGSVRGINQGLAQRTALNQSAGQAQSAAFQSALLRNQEELQAEEQLANVLQQRGGLQIGQEQAATGLLGTAGGLQNQQNQARIANLAQQQQLQAQVAAQNTQLRMEEQLANQQTAFKNADLYMGAMTLNEQLAARNLQAAMQAQSLNQNTSMGNAQLRYQADALNQNTSMGNAQLAGQTNAINASSYSNWLNNYTQTNAINASTYANWLNAGTQRSAINSGIYQGNAQQKAANVGGVLGALGQIGAMAFGFHEGGEVPDALPGSSAAAGYGNAPPGYADGGMISGGALAKLLPFLAAKNGGGGGMGGGFNFIHPALMQRNGIFDSLGGPLAAMRGGGQQQPGAGAGMSPDQFSAANPDVLGLGSLSNPMADSGIVDPASMVLNLPPLGAVGPPRPPSLGNFQLGSPVGGMADGGLVPDQTSSLVPHAQRFAGLMRPAQSGWGQLLPQQQPAASTQAPQAAQFAGLMRPDQGGWGQLLQHVPQAAQFAGLARPDQGGWGQLLNHGAPAAQAQQQMPQQAVHAPLQETHPSANDVIPGVAPAQAAQYSAAVGPAIQSAMARMGTIFGGAPPSPSMPLAGAPMPQQMPAQAPAPAMPQRFMPATIQGGLPFRAMGAYGGGMIDAQAGGQVPGQPQVPGANVPQNDTVTAKLTPQEIVLPLSVTQAPDAPARAAAFVAAIEAKKRGGMSSYAMYLGGSVPRVNTAPPSLPPDYTLGDHGAEYPPHDRAPRWKPSVEFEYIGRDDVRWKHTDLANPNKQPVRKA